MVKLNFKTDSSSSPQPTPEGSKMSVYPFFDLAALMSQLSSVDRELGPKLTLVPEPSLEALDRQLEKNKEWFANSVDPEDTSFECAVCKTPQNDIGYEDTHKMVCKGCFPKFQKDSDECEGCQGLFEKGEVKEVEMIEDRFDGEHSTKSHGFQKLCSECAEK